MSKLSLPTPKMTGQPTVSLKVMNEKISTAIYNDASFHYLACFIKQYLESCGVRVVQ